MRHTRTCVTKTCKIHPKWQSRTCAPSVLAPDVWTRYTHMRVRCPRGDSPSCREFGDCSCPTWVCEVQLSIYSRSFRIPCGTNAKTTRTLHKREGHPIIPKYMS